MSECENCNVLREELDRALEKERELAQLELLFSEVLTCAMRFPGQPLPPALVEQLQNVLTGATK